MAASIVIQKPHKKLMSFYTKTCLKNKGVHMFGDLNDYLVFRNNKVNAMISYNSPHQMNDKSTLIMSQTFLDILPTYIPTNQTQ